MEHAERERRMAALAALGDPLRRALYRFVATQDHAVSRQEAAEAAGTSRSAAAFHLDRMVDDGLLQIEFRRLSGRAGPGAGRPSKLYRRASRDIAVSLPPRQYDLAADLLASAVKESAAAGAAVEPALERLARRRGAELAGALRPHGSSHVATVSTLTRLLDDQGYEPRLAGGELVLANCPFRALVAHHSALVCGMNHALLQGVAAAFPAGRLTARLEPAPGRCCVCFDLRRSTRRKS